LIRALAIRGDEAARPAVLDMLAKSNNVAVRVAAIESIGKLGQPADAALLMQRLSNSTKQEQSAAQKSLVDLRGTTFVPLLVAEMKRSDSPIRVEMLKILVARRELDAIPAMAIVSIDDDAQVRQSAMVALSEIAGPEQIPRMLQGVLKAVPGKERDAAEKCVLSVCNRIEAPNQRAVPVLEAMKTMSANQRTSLLSTLGRIGGTGALTLIDEALANPTTQLEGLRGLCNWPNASIAPRLIELIQKDKYPGHSTTALRALIRVAPLADDRTDDERLKLLRRAMTLCTRDVERIFVLDRCRTIRTLDSLNYVLSFANQPAVAEQACLSIVEMAHHREFRDANKAEFEKALDLVIATSKAPVTLDRAQRYKKGQTWARQDA